jgi:hypothetical protein
MNINFWEELMMATSQYFNAEFPLVQILSGYICQMYAYLKFPTFDMFVIVDKKKVLRMKFIGICMTWLHVTFNT